MIAHYSEIYNLFPKPKKLRSTKKIARLEAEKKLAEAEANERANAILQQRDYEVDADIAQFEQRTADMENDGTRYTNYGVEHPTMPGFDPDDKTGQFRDKKFPRKGVKVVKIGKKKNKTKKV